MPKPQAEACHSPFRLYEDFDDESESSDNEDDKSPETSQSPSSPDNGLDAWREFQQKLIASEESELSRELPFMSASRTQRISNVNDIMPGSILLATLPSKYEQGYGLGRQYLHKSIIYIVDVDFEGGIIGLILNRTPFFELGLLDIEGKMLEESSDGWIVGLGGDSFRFDKETECVDTSASSVTALFFKDVDPMCETCREISSGVYFASQCTARAYVHDGLAVPDEFWLFYGHMHWSFEELRQEFDEKIWQGIEIVDEGEAANILRSIWSYASSNYGMSVWEQLRVSRASSEGSFDDRMLEEYCLASLPMTRANHKDADYYDREYQQRGQAGTYSLKVGDMLRASSASHSPFLLSDQEYHHSVILVLQEEKQFSIGVILNLPSAEAIHLTLGEETIDPINVRYGGPMKYSGAGESEVLFFHKSKAMKDFGLGDHLDVDSPSYNIWKCTKEEATEALVRGIVKSDDIMAFDGLCVWPKDDFGGGGLRAELVQGHFERVPLSNYDAVWKILQQQTHLSITNIGENSRIADAAWDEAGIGKDSTSAIMKDERRRLADEAHRKWIEIYLLR